MKLWMRATKTYPAAQALGFFLMCTNTPIRNRTLSDEQKESNRQRSKIRVRIEHVFGYMSRSMKGFYLRYVGRRDNAAAIGLIKLIYNRARYEQMARLKLPPRTAVSTAKIKTRNDGKPNRHHQPGCEKRFPQVP